MKKLRMNDENIGDDVCTNCLTSLSNELQIIRCLNCNHNIHRNCLAKSGSETRGKIVGPAHTISFMRCNYCSENIEHLKQKILVLEAASKSINSNKLLKSLNDINKNVDATRSKLISETKQQIETERLNFG